MDEICGLCGRFPCAFAVCGGVKKAKKKKGQITISNWQPHFFRSKISSLPSHPPSSNRSSDGAASAPTASWSRSRHRPAAGRNGSSGKNRSRNREAAGRLVCATHLFYEGGGGGTIASAAGTRRRHGRANQEAERLHRWCSKLAGFRQKGQDGFCPKGANLITLATCIFSSYLIHHSVSTRSRRT